MLQQFTLCLTLGALLLAGVCFLVEPGRFGGSSALVTEGGDEDLFLVVTLTDGEGGGEFDDFAGFAALAIVMHFTAVDGGTGEGAGFEKACGPEPFIQANSVGRFCHGRGWIYSR